MLHCINTTYVLGYLYEHIETDVQKSEGQTLVIFAAQHLTPALAQASCAGNNRLNTGRVKNKPCLYQKQEALQSKAVK